jgi:F0F1-type ATP synthase assembly protein I
MPFHRPIPNGNRSRPPSSGIASLVEAEKLMQIAILLPSAAFVGWIGGFLADKWLHQTWIATVGIVFGGISGLVYVVRLALETGKESMAKSMTAVKTEEGDPEIKP